MDRMRGTVLLLGAALVWGMAFAFQTQASGSISPFSFVAAKSALAAGALGIVAGIRHFSTRKPTAAQESFAAVAADSNSRRTLIVGGIACGIVLFAADNLQQAGITVYPVDAAASGRAGFLTATYVVMASLASPFLGKKIHPVVFAAAGVCIVGMYLLCLSGGIDGVYAGDLICLAGAVFYTVHLFIIDRFAKCDPVKLTMLQFITSAVISGIAAAVFEHPAPEVFLGALGPLLYVGVISSGVGYTLQTAGQRYADPAVAAIVMSLESVFAAVGGWLLLGEVLGGRELLGCALMFAAVLLAQVPELAKSRAKS